MRSFDLGSIDVTRRASTALSAAEASPDEFFARHRAGDWGAVDERRRRANEFAVEHGHTIHVITSMYSLSDVVLVVRTAPDKSWTRMQLPGEDETQDIDSQAGYAMWAATYDQLHNPLSPSKDRESMRLSPSCR